MCKYFNKKIETYKNIKIQKIQLYYYKLQRSKPHYYMMDLVKYNEIYKTSIYSNFSLT